MKTKLDGFTYHFIADVMGFEGIAKSLVDEERPDGYTPPVIVSDPADPRKRNFITLKCTVFDFCGLDYMIQKSGFVRAVSDFNIEKKDGLPELFHTGTMIYKMGVDKK